jgi:hypothetical protein
MEEGAGYSKVNMPAWDKPMWDTFEILPGWEMEAPSFAGAVDLVVQVVATIATAPVGGFGGAVLGAAIGSVDDLMFTALEVGTGYILPEQGVFQAVQTLLKAGVQVAAQGAFQGYEKQAGGLMAAWGKDFLGEATVNVLQQFTTNVANGFIDAHSLEVEDGKVVGWHFDGDQWAESVYGVRALAGYAGSFARSATQSLLKGTAVGFLGEGANNYNALIKTASALAGEGVGSLIDGEFSINVLNLTDILSPFIEDKDLLAKMDMGLFSMNFARDKNGNLKTTSRINSAGANVGGLVGLARSVAGLTEAYDNIRIGLSGADEKTTIALRGISSNGQEKSANLFEEILSGKTTLQEAFDVAVGQLAETTRTELGKQIGVDLASLNGFELGVVLAHEAMRNGQKDGEVEQVLETRNSVLAHSDHALQVLEKYGPGALNRHMSQEALIYSMVQNGEISKEAFKAYVDETYDSSEDFWRVLVDENGVSIQNDGSMDITFVNAEGEEETISVDDMDDAASMATIRDFITGLRNARAEEINAAVELGIENPGVNNFNFVQADWQALFNVSMRVNSLTALVDAANNNQGILVGINSLRTELNGLIGSGLVFSNLPEEIDREEGQANYSILNGNTLRTTKFGSRLRTPALPISGQDYFWGQFRHEAEDFSGANRDFIMPMGTTNFQLNYSIQKGLLVQFNAEGNNGVYQFELSHNNSSSIQQYVLAALASGSSTEIDPGLHFASMGSTGTASTGTHLHLEIRNPQGRRITPTTALTELNIPLRYRDWEVTWTGFSENVPYDDLSVLRELDNYWRENVNHRNIPNSLNDFGQAYLDAHNLPNTRFNAELNRWERIEWRSDNIWVELPGRRYNPYALSWEVLNENGQYE